MSLVELVQKKKSKKTFSAVAVTAMGCLDRLRIIMERKMQRLCHKILQIGAIAMIAATASAITSSPKTGTKGTNTSVTIVKNVRATATPIKITATPMSLPVLDTHIMPAGAPPDRRNVFSIVYNGYRRSSLEPCGCVSHKLGGIDREARIISRLADLSLAMIRLEAGGYIRDNAMASGNFRAASKHLLRALAALDYDVFNVGAPDIAAGKQFLEEQLGTRADRLVSANILDPQTSTTVFAKYRIVELRLANGESVRVGVTGVTRQRMAPFGKSTSSFIIADPASSLKAVLPELREKADVVVLLAYMNRDALKSLLSELGPDVNVDIAIAGEFLGAFQEIDNFQGVRVVSGGFEGRHVGHMLVAYQNGKILHSLNKLVEIEQTIEPKPEFTHFITDYLGELRKGEGASEGNPH